MKAVTFYFKNLEPTPCLYRFVSAFLLFIVDLTFVKILGRYHEKGHIDILRFHVGVCHAIKQEKVYTQGQLKLTHIHFVILISYVKVIYLRFIKNPYF